MRFSIFGSFATVLLSACTIDATESVAANSSCNAEDYEHLKWQNADVLETVDIDGPYRVFGRDAAVTMDYRPERLNFVTGDTGRIEVIRCG